MGTILTDLLDSFLTSPIVELIVGSGDKKTAMTAHQSLLLESPLLSEQVKAFGEGPVSGTLFSVWWCSLIDHTFHSAGLSSLMRTSKRLAIFYSINTHETMHLHNHKPLMEQMILANSSSNMLVYTLWQRNWAFLP
jgi:hypothetical protein